MTSPSSSTRLDNRRETRSAISKALHDQHVHGVDVHVRAPGEIETKMHDVGWIDYDIGREGVVVYVAGAGAMWQPPVPRVREAPIGVPNSVAWWRRFAEVDTLVIENELRAGVIPWSAVCFHAQQAAEKYLKALLIQRNVRPERTHELSDLVVAARKAGYALDGIDDDCTFLTPFAVDVRYPDDSTMPEPNPPPDEATGRRAVGSVRRIVEAVKPLLIPQ